jgi:hypothetical protein
MSKFASIETTEYYHRDTSPSHLGYFYHPHKRRFIVSRINPFWVYNNHNNADTRRNVVEITVEWDDAGETVLLYTVTGVWTWQEFYAARDRGRELVEKAGRSTVNSIIDMSKGSLFPQNALRHFRRLPDESQSQFEFGLVVIVEDNPFVEILIDMMRRLNPKAMRNFYRERTLEGARDRLARLQAAETAETATT